MDRTRLILVTALGLLPPVAQAQTIVLAPEDLPRMLAEGNQAVRGAALLAESAESLTGHLVRSYLPTFNFELGGEAFQTGPYATSTQPYGLAEARINLFRGGKDLFENRILAASARGAAAQAERTKAQLLSEARRIYWTLVYQREQIRVLRSALEENSKNLASANRRIQRGLTTDTDRLDFQINESQLNEEIESIFQRTLQTKLQLRAVLGIEGEEELKTLDEVPHEHDEALVSLNLDPDSQYEVSYLKATEEVARSERNRLSRWWAPSVDAYSGFYQYTLRDRDYLSQGLRVDMAAGVQLTLHLDAFQGSVATHAASVRADGLQNQLLQLARDTRARFRSAQDGMKLEHGLIHEAEKRIGQGQTYLSKTLAEYDRGVKNAPDVLSASQRLLGFRRRASEIRKNYQLAKVELLSLLGKE